MATHFGRSLRAAGIACSLLLPAILQAQSSATDSLRSALLLQARSRNPDLVWLRAAARTAAARVDAARAREAPVLSLEVDEIPDGAAVWRAGQMQVGLEQELFSGRRRATAAEVSALELRQHERAIELEERTLEARLDRELTQWRGQRAIDQRLALEDALLHDVEEGLAARFATGQARYVDVLRVRTERLRVQTERAEAIEASSLARLRLLLLADVDSLQPADGEVLPVPDALPTPARVDSLMAVLDATGAFTHATALAEAGQRRALAERGVRVGGGIGIQRFGEPGNFAIGPSLRASASLPFAVGRSNTAVRHAGALAIAEQSARAAARRARTRGAMQQASDRYLAARTRAQLFDAALLRGSRSERDAAFTAYRTGELTLLELLDFERALARAETDQLRAVMEAHGVYAELFELMRGSDD